MGSKIALMPNSLAVWAPPPLATSRGHLSAPGALKGRRLRGEGEGDEQSATKWFLTVGAGDAPGGDACVHGASNVETVEGQVGRQHSFGPNIEGAIYAAAQYGHLSSPFLDLLSPLLSCLRIPYARLLCTEHSTRPGAR